MKAVVVEHLNEQGSLKEWPVPPVGPRDVLVAVAVAGVNPVDWKTRDQARRPLPFVLGQDFSGLVTEVGNEVRRYRPGERLFGIARKYGSYAECTLVPEDDNEQPVAKIPDDVGDADAAALPTAGLTALASLEELHVASESTLLVLGATGGVGGIAVQIARERGARVIGTARASNEQHARSLGVAEFIAYDTGNIVEAVRRAHSEGVDAVLDLVDDADSIKRMADVVHAQGRIVSTIGACDVDWFAARNIVAKNLVLFETPTASHEGLRTLVKMLEEGRLRVTIAQEHPLAQATQALDESKAGRVDGKLVLTVR